MVPILHGRRDPRPLQNPERGGTTRGGHGGHSGVPQGAVPAWRSSPPASPGPSCPPPTEAGEDPPHSHPGDRDSHPGDTPTWGHPDMGSWGGVQGKETQGLGTLRKGDPGVGDAWMGTGMGSWERGPQGRGPRDGVPQIGAPAEGDHGVGDLGVGSRVGSWTWGHQGKGTQGWVPEDGDLGMGSQGKGLHGWGQGWGLAGSRNEMGHRARSATPVLLPPCPVLPVGCHRGPTPLDPMAAPSGLTLLATYLALQLATGEQLGTLRVAPGWEGPVAMVTRAVGTRRWGLWGRQLQEMGTQGTGSPGDPEDGDPGGDTHESWGPSGLGHQGIWTWGREPWRWGPKDGHLGVGTQ